MNGTIEAAPLMPEADGFNYNGQEELGGITQSELDTAFNGIVEATFGSQLMKTYQGTEDLPVMSGGPTWTGTGATQDADDGDTGGGGSDD